jgi:hypothetical protein
MLHAARLRHGKTKMDLSGDSNEHVGYLLMLTCLLTCAPHRYERLEAQVGECYEGQVELVPSPEELADLFSHVGTG